MKKGRPPSRGEVEPIHDLQAGLLERGQHSVEVFDVYRDVVQAFSPAPEKTLKKAVRASAFHELQAVIADAELRNGERLIIAGMGNDLDSPSEIGLEETERRSNLLEREREMIDLPFYAMALHDPAPAWQAPGTHLGFLPKLNERPEGRARMDEGGLVAVAVIMTADDLVSVVLQSLEERIEPLDLEGKMMKALAAAFEESLYEAPGPHALDQLDFKISNREVRPPKLAVVAVLLGSAGARGKKPQEKLERRVDVTHGDRHVIYA